MKRAQELLWTLCNSFVSVRAAETGPRNILEDKQRITTILHIWRTRLGGVNRFNKITVTAAKQRLANSSCDWSQREGEGVGDRCWL